MSAGGGDLVAQPQLMPVWCLSEHCSIAGAAHCCPSPQEDAKLSYSVQDIPREPKTSAVFWEISPKTEADSIRKRGWQCLSCRQRGGALQCLVRNYGDVLDGARGARLLLNGPFSRAWEPASPCLWGAFVEQGVIAGTEQWGRSGSEGSTAKALCRAGLESLGLSVMGVP